MIDKDFMEWWIGRIGPHRDVAPEKLQADQEAVRRLQEFNRNYTEFLTRAVFPAVEQIVKILARNRIIHRVSTWGNQLSMRIHLNWRWGELVISQSHEDCVTFAHHIVTEGERRGEDSADDHTHQYDLRDFPPVSVADQELQFFLSRIAQDLLEEEPEAEIPPANPPQG